MLVTDRRVGPAPGLMGTISAPLPVARSLGRVLSTRASQDAADAGLAGSPLAYTSAGSLTQADSAEDGGPEAFGRGRFGSFRRSLSYGQIGGGSGRGGSFGRASPAARGAVLGTRDRGADEGSGPARGGQGATEGGAALANGGAPDQAPAPDAPPPLAPLRTVTERSESLATSAGDAGTPLTTQGITNGAHGSLPTRADEAAAAAGAPVGKAPDGGPGAWSDPHKGFAQRRQVPLGKLAILLLLFAGAPAASQPGPPHPSRRPVTDAAQGSNMSACRDVPKAWLPRLFMYNRNTTTAMHSRGLEGSQG